MACWDGLTDSFEGSLMSNLRWCHRCLPSRKFFPDDAWNPMLFPSPHVSHKGAVWLVDASPLSQSTSRLRNAGRCWRGSGQRPSQRGLPDAAGLSYSWPMGSRSPKLPPGSGSPVVLSTNGCSGFSMRACRGWQINLDLAAGAARASRTVPEKNARESHADLALHACVDRAALRQAAAPVIDRVALPPRSAARAAHVVTG